MKKKHMKFKTMMPAMALLVLFVFMGTSAWAGNVVSTVPTDGATNVSVNTEVTVTFSDEIDSSSITGDTLYLTTGSGYKLRSIAGTITTTGYGLNTVPGNVTSGGTAATFTPSSPLNYETTYTVTVTKGVKFADGSSLQADHQVSFTTEKKSVTPETPEIDSTTPAKNAASVDVNTAIKAVFSKTMDTATLTSATFFVKTGSGYGMTDVSGTVTYTDKTATFTPSSALAYATAYVATVTTGATDTEGNALAADYTWSFVTRQQGGTSSPVVEGFVVTDEGITVTFSKNMNPSTVKSALTIRGEIPGLGFGVLIPEDIIVSGTEATFVLSSDLRDNLNYKIVIGSDATAEDGTVLQDYESETFTTDDIIPVEDVNLETAMTLDAIMARLEELQTISLAYEDRRATGTPGYDAAVEYLKDELDAIGFTYSEQPVEFRYFEELEDPVMEQTAPSEVTYTTTDHFASMSYSGNGDVTAELVFITPTFPPGADPGSSDDGCEPEDFEGIDVTGKIAVIQRGSCDFTDKAKNAQDAGALGVIVFNEGQEGRTGIIYATLGEDSTVTIPALGTTYELGQELYNLTQTEAVTFHINVNARDEQRTANNVIAEAPGGNPDQVVMLGAHLDCASTAPGVNDNGSGSMALLELAYQISETGYQPVNKLRFAWWTAEEDGLVGSYAYLDSLSEADIAKIGMYLNFDMIGSNNYTIFTYDGDLSDTADDPTLWYAPEEIPTGTAEIETVFLDYFDSKGLKAYPGTLDGRSDYEPFIYADIPVGGADAGGDRIKTEEQAALYGGTAGEQYDVCYHKDCDDTENLNQDALIRISKSMGYAAQYFGDKADLFGPKVRKAGFSGKVRTKDAVMKHDRLHSDRHLRSVE